jgi:TolA-binding protein
MGRLRLRLAAALMLAAPVLAPPPVQAQMESREAIQLQNQILELRRDLQAMRQQISRMGSGGGGSAVAAPPSRPSGGDNTGVLFERIQTLEDQVRRLQGRIDEADNARQRADDQLRKDIEDLAFKLGQGGGAARPPAAAPAPAPSGGGSAARRTPELAIQEGNAALARRDYAAAEAAAREVLAFPRSPRATDAQFLLAQALSGKRDWQAAAVAYDDTYNRGKTGTYAQPALLGLANSLTAINEKRAACATLDKLRAEFPNPRADLREPIAAARQRAGCR